MNPAPPPFDRATTYRRYLAALLCGNRADARICFEQWLAATPDLRTLYEDLVMRALYEVGELWEHGEISVATEHLATAISESLLNLTYPRLFTRPRVNRSAVIACVANEYHQIGGKMVADLFELHGWRGYFLGANTPLADAHSLIAEKQPDVVALSVASSLNLPRLIAAAIELRHAFPSVPILTGGQAFRWGGRAEVERLPAVRCLGGLGELETWIREHTHRV
jgi:methanogenic corrinoid protein MtbC1